MANCIRHVFALMIAVPLVLGLAGSGFAAPCAAHAHDTGDADCPCCPKSVLTGAMSCGLACQTGIDLSSRTLPRQPEELRISFLHLHERAEGIEIEPQLPPPR